MIVSPFPSDPFWPIRVKVAVDGDQLPYELWLWYHWMFAVRTEGYPA